MFLTAICSARPKLTLLPIATVSIWVQSAKPVGPMSSTGGGMKGFLKVLDPATLAFADYRGNRQLLSTGNFHVNDRVALFLMDYKNQARLKILGHARVEDVRENAALAEWLVQGDRRNKVERVVTIEVVSYDWNCPKYITPRYSLDEVEEAIAPLKSRIAELEAQLGSVRP